MSRALVKLTEIETIWGVARQWPKADYYVMTSIITLRRGQQNLDIFTPQMLF